MFRKSILHYKILEKLGEGGMGIVYLAEDTKLDRKVAIKFLPRHVAGNTEERKRLEIEAKAAAALNHPNIATIHAIEETTENELFLVMEYIQGQELKDIIKLSKTLPLRDAMDIAIQIGEGLQVAHERGVVHRDIKSSNIMITEKRRVKIMDFGLAKIGTHEQFTRERSTIGTIAYMSPEQTNGDHIDHRTDIWSFGVVFYEMLMGEMPFKGEYEQAVIYSILNEAPVFPENWEETSLPVKVIKKALQKDPEKRYESVEQLIEDLKTGFVRESSPSVQKMVNEIKKLAVLPFSNLIDDPQTNFLGFAIADQVIGSLAYMRNMLVRPSSAIRKYQSDIFDIQEAGAQLDVSFILTGNYLKESDTIRLNIELVDLDSGRMIWRETIQVKYQNVFELQDIVSSRVVDQLKIQFSNEERERMKPDIPQNQDAFEYYLRAVAFSFTIEGNNQAIQMLEKSISIDPLYAPAYLDLGIRYHQLAQVGSDTSEAVQRAEKYLLKALSLKHDLLPALANLALIYTDNGKHEEAHVLLIRALKINPNQAWLHFSLSYHYRYIGFLDESEKEWRIALSIDPNNPRFRSGIITLMFLGKYDEILLSFNLDKESPFTLNYLGEVALRAGNNDLALEYFEKVIRINDEIGELYFAESLIAYLHGDLYKAAEFNHKRAAENPADGEIWYEIARLYGLFNMEYDCYEALKKSIDLGYISYPSMSNDTFLDAVKDKPGMQQLLSETNRKFQELKLKLDTSY